MRRRHRRLAVAALGLAVLGATALLAGCVGKPADIAPVTPFDTSRYLGTWYESARMDHRFERGLDHVSAQYSLRPDGGLKVINRGYKAEGKEWKESEGKAYFVDGPGQGFLKVSFFGPFYGAYVVFDLDTDYRTSMVTGPDKSYFWLLSRTPTLDAAVQQRLLETARNKGFDTSRLIFVNQAPANQPPVRPTNAILNR